MTGPKKLLLVVVKESDTWHGTPLYEAFVQRLRASAVAGATVQTGIMGFGRHHRMHHKGLFGIADDRPVTIFALDDAAKLKTAVDDAREMLAGAMVLWVDAEVP